MKIHCTTIFGELLENGGKLQYLSLTFMTCLTLTPEKTVGCSLWQCLSQSYAGRIATHIALICMHALGQMLIEHTCMLVIRLYAAIAPVHEPTKQACSSAWTTAHQCCLAGCLPTQACNNYFAGTHIAPPPSPPRADAEFCVLYLIEVGCDSY